MLSGISIRSRQLAIVIILLVGFVLVGLFTVFSLASIQANTQHTGKIANDQILISEIDADINTLMIQLYLIQSDSTLAQDAAFMIEQILERLNIRLRQFVTIRVPGLQIAYTRFELIQQTFRNIIVPQIQSGNGEGVITGVSQIRGDVERLRTLLQTVESHLNEESAAQIQDTDYHINTVLWQLILALVLLGAVSSVLLLSNNASVSSGIQTLSDGAKRLVTADVRDIVQFPENRRDEFSKLGEDFNSMANMIILQRSAIHQHIEALEHARALAENAAERKSAYLANMSHELRTPMHVIMNFTRLLLEGELGQLGEDQQHALTRVLGSATHLLKVINDILDIARIEAGQLEINPVPLDLHPIMLEMQQDASVLIGSKADEVDFLVKLPDSLPIVLADEIRVRQILLNLVGNAIRFTEQGMVTVSFGVGADELTICVEDTGVGIPPHKLDTIFGRFEQAGADDKRRTGAGLGLAISRDLVRLQRGRIWANSVLDKGSTFCFTLPIVAQLLENPVKIHLDPKTQD